MAWPLAHTIITVERTASANGSSCQCMYYYMYTRMIYTLALAHRDTATGMKLNPHDIYDHMHVLIKGNTGTGKLSTTTHTNAGNQRNRTA